MRHFRLRFSDKASHNGTVADDGGVNGPYMPWDELFQPLVKDQEQPRLRTEGVLPTHRQEPNSGHGEERDDIDVFVLGEEGELVWRESRLEGSRESHVGVEGDSRRADVS